MTNQVIDLCRNYAFAVLNQTDIMKKIKIELEDLYHEFYGKDTICGKIVMNDINGYLILRQVVYCNNDQSLSTELRVNKTNVKANCLIYQHRLAKLLKIAYKEYEAIKKSNCMMELTNSDGFINVVIHQGDNGSIVNIWLQSFCISYDINHNRILEVIPNIMSEEEAQVILNNLTYDNVNIISDKYIAKSSAYRGIYDDIYMNNYEMERRITNEKKLYVLKSTTGSMYGFTMINDGDLIKIVHRDITIGYNPLKKRIEYISPDIVSSESVYQTLLEYGIMEIEEKNVKRKKGRLK